MEPRLISHDLTSLHDSTRVLENPHNGWYHHFPDNHPDKYRIARDADLLEFPGMDHLYIRLAWSYLEPNEGQFNWAVIDDLIAKWTAHGLGISFRISCKEAGTDRVEQQYAAPRWVMAAGAKGGHFRSGKVAGPDAPWVPVFDDPNLNLDSQNRRWLPLPQGGTHTARYVLDIPKTTRPGRYALKFKLHSPEAQRDVFLALSPKLLDNENFHNLGMIEIAE
jgi:Beta-galactosidase